MNATESTSHTTSSTKAMFDSGRAQLLPEPAGRCTVWVSRSTEVPSSGACPLDHAVADLGAGLRRHQLAGQRDAERERHRLLGREPAGRDLLAERLPADRLDQRRVGERLEPVGQHERAVDGVGGRAVGVGGIGACARPACR